MSVLSYNDIIRELGKGILIHPLKYGSIKACDICLTASEYAYAVNTQKRLDVQKGVNQSGEEQLFLEIPPKDTTLMWTDESVYLCDRFRGPLYSIVNIVSQGIGHIGTRVNPCWAGVLCIPLHNYSEHPIRINIRDVNQPVAYLAVEKLSSKFSRKHNNIDKSARLDILENQENTKEIHDFFSKKSHVWMVGDLEALKMEMLSSPEYKQLKKGNIDIFINSIFSAYALNYWSTLAAILAALAAVSTAIFAGFQTFQDSPSEQPSQQNIQQNK